MTARRRLLTAVCLTLLAASLRFYKLGEWPFGGDELATIVETEALFNERVVPENSQAARLPRAIPLSYVIQQLGYRLFGKNEFGSRVIPAVFGSLSVGLVFWFLDVTLGWSTALSTSLLLLLWPEHIFHSQINRFYAIVAFFSFMALLFGALYAQTRRAAHLLSAQAMILLAALAHTLMVVLLPILFVGVLAAAYRDARPLPRVFFAVQLASGALILVFFWWYLRPILAGWNQGESWGYSFTHSALASLNLLGWPVTLMACIGFLVMISGAGLQYYWLVSAIAFGAATLMFPMAVAYHPEYVFSLGLGPIVLAACAVGVVFERLKAINRAAAVGWFLFVPLCELPSAASHFVDGSRSDFRAAAAYVKAHWSEGATVTGFSMGTFNYYAPQCVPAVPLSPSRTVEQLSSLTRDSASGPLWVVVHSGRSGLEFAVEAWLNEQCQRRLEVKGRRFDYFDYRVEVYACARK